MIELGTAVVPTVTAPKASDDGEKVGASSVPVPVRLLVPPELLKLPLNVRVPVAAPVAVGLKVSVSVQLLFAASTPVHPSLMIAKLPDTATLLMVTAIALLFFTVAILVPLVRPTTTLPKAVAGASGDRRGDARAAKRDRVLERSPRPRGRFAAPVKLPTAEAVKLNRRSTAAVARRPVHRRASAPNTDRNLAFNSQVPPPVQLVSSLGPAQAAPGSAPSTHAYMSGSSAQVPPPVQLVTSLVPVQLGARVGAARQS